MTLAEELLALSGTSLRHLDREESVYPNLAQLVGPGGRGFRLGPEGGGL